MLARLEQVRNKVSDRKERGAAWEEMVKTSLSEFEALARHLRSKLLRFPMTPNRRKRLEELNFQKPLQAHELLMQWFDIGVLQWPGDKVTPKRNVLDSDLPFIKKMIQKRHILIHSGGIVDQAYLDLSGDTQVRLSERISVASKEAKRFLECVRAMGANLVDNVEDGFVEG
jgi:hypothetical protein